MDLGIIALRLLHVGGGILWAGGSVVMALFVEPTADELGPAAGPFMTGVMQKRKLGIYFELIAAVTVVFGSVLYWIDSNGDPIAYLTSGHMGTGLGIAGILAWIAFLVASIFIGPNAMRIAGIAGQLRESASPPPTDLLAAMGRAQHQMKLAGQVGIVLLAVVIACMATARYWP